MRLPAALIAKCEKSLWAWMLPLGYKCQTCLSKTHSKTNCNADAATLAAAKLKIDPVQKKRKRSVADVRRKWQAAGCPATAPFF
jgi:hypothetical protein